MPIIAMATPAPITLVWKRFFAQKKAPYPAMTTKKTYPDLPVEMNKMFAKKPTSNTENNATFFQLGRSKASKTQNKELPANNTPCVA